MDKRKSSKQKKLNKLKKYAKNRKEKIDLLYQKELNHIYDIYLKKFYSIATEDQIKSLEHDRNGERKTLIETGNKDLDKLAVEFREEMFRISDKYPNSGNKIPDFLKEFTSEQ